MKVLSKFELAAVKRTAQNVSMQRRKKAKLEEKVAALQSEIESLDYIINSFEAPVIAMSGGFTSEEILSGAMEAINEDKPEGELDETATVDEIEVPASEAVTIDPSVQSPLAPVGEDLGEDNSNTWGPIGEVE